jgi:hypothetical protein
METCDREIDVVLGLLMLMGIIQKRTLSYFTTKGEIYTQGFGDSITRDRLELIF